MTAIACPVRKWLQDIYFKMSFAAGDFFLKQCKHFFFVRTAISIFHENVLHVDWAYKSTYLNFCSMDFDHPFHIKSPYIPQNHRSSLCTSHSLRGTSLQTHREMIWAKREVILKLSCCEVDRHYVLLLFRGWSDDGRSATNHHRDFNKITIFFLFKSVLICC